MRLNQNNLSLHLTEAPQGVLFDLDGTLLDSAPGILNTLYFLLDKYHLPRQSKEALHSSIGQGLTALIQKCAPTLPIEDAKTIAKEGFEHYIQHAKDYTRPYPGAESMLTHLNQNNIPWGIVTNKTRALMETVSTSIPNFSTSTTIICADDLDCKKPDPKPLLTAAKYLDSNPEQTLYIGDAYVDMLASEKAQMIGIIALYGYISNDYLQWPHLATLNSLSELIPWLQSFKPIN